MNRRSINECRAEPHAAEHTAINYISVDTDDSFLGNRVEKARPHVHLAAVLELLVQSYIVFHCRVCPVVTEI